MKFLLIRPIGMLYVLSFALFACQAQNSSQDEISEASEIYEYGKASYDGIGKYYLGREISHVMGHLGAGWLERLEREQEERTSLLIKNLELAPDDVIADIGAGTGYFTFPIAKQVPQGKVIAVDIQPEMLEMIREKKEKTGIDNIELIQGEETTPKLAPNSVDAVLFVDVYHELSHPKEMMDVIVAALKPGGKVYLVEYRLEDKSVPIKRLHKMSEEQAVKEMEFVGLELVENRNMLPWQHFMIFQKS